MSRLMTTCLGIAAAVAGAAPALAQTTEGAAVRTLQPTRAEGPMAALFDSLIGAPGGAAGGGDPDYFQREFGDSGGGSGGGSGAGGGGNAGGGIGASPDPGDAGGADPVFEPSPPPTDAIVESVSKAAKGGRASDGRGADPSGLSGDPGDRGP